MKNHGLGFVFALESNRLVSLEKGTWIQVNALDIPEEGLVVWLREFGKVKLFRTWLKDQPRHYAAFLVDEASLTGFDRRAFTEQHDRHWQIEQYHRAIKQVCNIERFQVRGAQTIKTICFQLSMVLCSCRK